MVGVGGLGPSPIRLGESGGAREEEERAEEECGCEGESETESGTC